jgi:hypothetical protein
MSAVLNAARGMGVVMLLALVIQSLPSTALAQASRPPAATYDFKDRGAQNPSGTQLPDWAEPRSPSDDDSRQGEAPARIQNQLNGTDLPTDPRRNIPLGGLEWLLAAGLGYGVYRLRGQGDGDAAA